jgi:membrane protein YqaA with SNARE-associated domain
MNASGDVPAPEPVMTRLELVLLIARLVVGLVVLGALVSFAGTHFRAPLMSLGAHVVERFGLVGMAGGTMVADGFQFPIPPQFYMLASIAAGAAPGPVLAAIVTGSLVGGHLGMLVTRRLAELAFVRRLTQRGPLPGMFRRHQLLAVTLGSVLPLPYSFVCYTCGVLKTPYRLFLIVVALRVPKLVLFYAVIRAGWGV